MNGHFTHDDTSIFITYSYGSVLGSVLRGGFFLNAHLFQLFLSGHHLGVSILPESTSLAINFSLFWKVHIPAR